MASLFNYNTLKVTLVKETKTLVVALNRPESKNAINMEMLFEFETLFSWASNHLEINSILIDSTTEFFSVGLSKEDLSKMEDQKIQRLMSKLQKLVYTMYFLPQTVVINLKNGALGIAAELSLGADIRIASPNPHINFNHLQNGITPSCGGIGILGELVPKAMAKNWMMTSRPINAGQLMASGLIQSFCDCDTEISDILEDINAQAPIVRIQAKRSFLESILPELDRAVEYEKNFAVAGMSMQDWKRKAMASLDNREVQFANPGELASTLKKEQSEKLSEVYPFPS